MEMGSVPKRSIDRYLPSRFRAILTDATQPGPECILVFMSDVTQILAAIEQGDAHAAEQLLPLVYDELRGLAAAKMAQEKPGQTLQATALVHEAYVRLVDCEKVQHWESKGHFFAAAAEAMRRILVDRAKARGAQKRGGGRHRIDFDSVDAFVEANPSQLLAIDEAIDRLTVLDETAAQLVRLHCFAGLTVAQAAESLAISVATGYRHWTYARVWLHRELTAAGEI
jgi:RNA polymerase sigma factor (TIGR02999 family)